MKAHCGNMLKRMSGTTVAAVVVNLLLALAMWMVSRVAFFLENYSTFAPGLSAATWGDWLKGALVFDTSGLLYVNLLWLVLVLLPWRAMTASPAAGKALRWLYVVTNGVALASNLIDSVYFKYTGRRSGVSVFSQFSNEDNIASILGGEFIAHWYLVVLMAAMAWLLWKGYRRPRVEACGRPVTYYVSQVVALLVAVPLAIVGMRGSVTAGTRPITVSNANQYVSRPVDAALVLNTPFSMIRSIGKKVYVVPDNISAAEARRIFNPERTFAPDSLSTQQGKNVVVIIVESLGKEYIGAFNRGMKGGTYRGYTPFVDSLVSRSMTYRYSYANGRISMDAMPSILSSIPSFVETFFLTPASLNAVEGLPSMLKREGYSSAFFHGGHNISMGFSAFAHAIGYERYYGLDEYCADDRYGGMDDFDGKWAIWDEPFLQFMADRLSTQRQPFVATVFTASSHHPYKIPAQYREVYRDEDDVPIHKCVRYTDMALRRFFERVSREPWYRNTLFVLVADHTNLTSHPEYETDLGLYSVPILFFTPDGSLPAGVNGEVTAQQIDILPTLLHLLGHRGEAVVFGKDLLTVSAGNDWAVSYNNGIYQLVKGDWLLMWDGEHSRAMYRFKEDPLLQHNLLSARPAEREAMEAQVKALIYQYMWRMNNNRLTPEGVLTR